MPNTGKMQEEESAASSGSVNPANHSPSVFLSSSERGFYLP